jgi:RNA polymerase sigma factor (sigma-70 family)
MATVPEQVTLERRRPLECDALFEGFYRGYRADVYEFSLRLVGRREDAEDVTLAFLNAYRALARGNAPRTPRAWLLTIARNVCMRRFRQQQRRPREVQLDPEIFEARANDDGATTDDVRSALQTLTSQERSALLLREFQELSYAEIASRLGLSISAVETLLFRARRSLREELERTGVTPSVPSRKRRTLGGLLPWPPSLDRLFGWFGSLGGGGLSAKASAITVAALIAGGAVVGTGVPPFGSSRARGLPSEPTRSTLLPSSELSTARDSSGRPSTRAPRAAADSQALLVAPRTETAGTSSVGVADPAETGGSPGSTAGHSTTASREAPPSVATPSPSLELPPPELEPPSLPPAPSVPEPPALEPPVLEPPALPAPPELDPPELEPPALPPPPELDPPELEPPALPPLPPAPPLP